MCHAVRNTSGTAAHSSNDHESLIGTMSLARALANSANPPCTWNPKTLNSLHKLSSPRVHHSQLPHRKPGAIITRWPTARPVTDRPSFATAPVTSQPPMCGIGIFIGRPRRTHKSR